MTYNPLTDFTAPLENLQGKNAVVTGGASGMGSDFVRALCSAGASVTIGDVSIGAGTALASELTSAGHKAQFIATDVSNFSSQDALFKAAITFSGSSQIDIVIPSAGNALTEPFFSAKQTPSLTGVPPAPPGLGLLNVHLLGTYYTAWLALHYFQHNATPESSKVLIFVASMASYVETPGLSEYAVAKTGVRALFKSLKREKTPYKLRVNLIAPSFIQTPLTERRKEFLEARGVKWARREDATKAVLKLAADEEVNGKAVGIVPTEEGVLDLEDDVESFSGGAVGLLRSEAEHMIRMMSV